MKKEQFTEGMRVVAIDKCDVIDLRGKTGTVRYVSVVGRCPIGVEFDEEFSVGHTLGGLLGHYGKKGWWCERDSLLPLTRFEIETIGAKTTVRGCINGREISATAKCADGDTQNAYVGALMAMEKAFGVEHREAKHGESVVVVRPIREENFTTGDVLVMDDRKTGHKIGRDGNTGRAVQCCAAEYVVIKNSAILQPPQRERKAVCIKAAPHDSPFREGRIYTVDGDGKIDTGKGKVQTLRERDARRIAAEKNRFLIIDEDTKEDAK